MTEAGPRRLLSAALRLRTPGPRVRRLVAVLATMLFTATVLWAIAGYRSAQLDVNWPLFVVAVAVGTPLAVALNAAELRVMARTVGADMTGAEALTSSLYASAANSLPLPGSVLVRGWSLREAGVPLARIVGVQALAGVTFMAVSAASTGPLIALTSPVAGLATTAVGVTTLAVIAVRHRATVARLAIVELAMVGSELGRISLVLAALGLDPSAPRAAGLVMANVAAVAVGVFPAGLGIRELFAAVIGQATALPAALAVAVSVTDRVGTSSVLALLVIAAVTASGLPARFPVGPQRP